MDKCPSEEELLAILNPVAARAPGTTRPVRQVEAHIASCESCRTVLALLLSEGAPSDAAPTSTGLRPGERVGHYRLGEVLGAGAMSVVYSALDERLDRTVALKVLRWDRGLGGADALLREEARALARVSSPFVVDVFDVGEHLGAVYIVMEMVVGETLRQFACASVRNPRERVMEALIQAGTGLADAHAAGVIHGDVKPENILICVDQHLGSAAAIRAKISDFGLALVPRRRGESSLGGPQKDERISYEPREVFGGKSSFVGTPAYMSPELFNGTRPNAKSDQYAFCVTAYEALAGERPFAPSRGQDVRDVNVDTLARIAMLPISASAARALLRGLHPDPSKRHPNMRALVDALRPRKWGAGALVAGATLLASVVAGVVWLAATRPAQDRCRDEAQPAIDLASPKTLEGFRSAFLATGSPSAAESARLVEAEWNRFLDEWRVARVSACHAQAAPVSDATSELSGVETCLSARLTDARAFHDAVLRVTPASVGAVAEAVYQLPSPRSCLANASARQATGPNRSAATPIPPETLAKLADARAHYYAGETAQARSHLATLQAILAEGPTVVGSAPSGSRTHGSRAAHSSRQRVSPRSRPPPSVSTRRPATASFVCSPMILISSSIRSRVPGFRSRFRKRAATGVPSRRGPASSFRPSFSRGQPGESR